MISPDGRLELEVRGLAPSVVSGIAEIVDHVLGELQAGLLEEAFPTDTLGPVAQALVFARVGGVSFHDLTDDFGQRGPAGRLVGDEGHDNLGELGIADAVGDLAASHDDEAVAGLVGQRQGRTHGVAVTAEHAALVLDGHGVHGLGLTGFGSDFLLGRTDGAYRAGGHGQRNFTEVVQPLVVDDGRFAVITQNSDVGAVHSAAHVQTAGHGNTHLSGHAHLTELFKQLVHDHLHGTGSIGSRGVAVHPALGMDDVGDAGARAADRQQMAAAGLLQAIQMLFQFFGLSQSFDHKLHVVAGGETQVSATEFIGDITDHTDIAHGHETGSTATHSVDFVTALSLVHQDSGFDNLVPQPLSFIFGNDRRQEIGEMARADVRNPVFHGLIRIISGRNKLHFQPPSYL